MELLGVTYAYIKFPSGLGPLLSNLCLYRSVLVLIVELVGLVDLVPLRQLLPSVMFSSPENFRINSWR